MSFRVFLDANVLFTAVYNPRGLARLLFDLHRRGSLSLLTSRLAIAEATVNLEIKKPAAVDDLRELVAETELVDAPTKPALILDLPSKDLAIFSAAVRGKATHLLTGDKKHFGRFFNKPKRTGGITIQTIREFYELHFGLE